MGHKSGYDEENKLKGEYRMFLILATVIYLPLYIIVGLTKRYM